MRTTLDLPDETFRQLKAQAALNGLKLKELVTQLIQRGLAAGVTAPMPEQPSGPPPTAIARVEGSPLTPALTNEQLHAILEDQELEHYQKVLPPSGGAK